MHFTRQYSLPVVLITCSRDELLWGVEEAAVYKRTNKFTIQIHTHVHVSHVRIYVCADTHACTHTHTSTHSYMYTHTHTHTYVHVLYTHMHTPFPIVTTHPTGQVHSSVHAHALVQSVHAP